MTSLLVLLELNTRALLAHSRTWFIYSVLGHMLYHVTITWLSCDHSYPCGKAWSSQPHSHCHKTIQALFCGS